MKLSPSACRVLLIVVILVPLAGLFLYTAFRSGPLAPVAVTVIDIQTKALSPNLSGIGTVEAHYRFKIGPTRTGRLTNLSVDVGDSVEEGQALGTMDPIDLDDRIASQQS